jgi:hypothetical protein
MINRSVATIACAVIGWFGYASAARAAGGDEASVEIGAGGLSFAANSSIRIEQQDVLVTPDKVAITYTLRNDADTPQSIFMSFQLPDLDANAVTDGEIAITPGEPANFVQFATTVDGQPVVPRTEQRAMALGLDVTGGLDAAGLKPFPFAKGLAARLEALGAAQRTDLLERGIVKEDGAALAPAWSLKSVAYWRQTFAAGQTITIMHSYRPVSGTSSFSEGALEAARRRSCLTRAQEDAIAKLKAAAAVAPTLASITYAATPGADALGPVRRFRLIVETGDPATVVASCREGLKRTGPLQLEWTASDYAPEEDFQLLFVR